MRGNGCRSLRLAFCGLVLEGLLVLVGSGCSSSRGPIAPKYIDPSFAPASVHEIVFVAVADIRVDKAQAFDARAFMIDGGFRWRYVKVLKERGYTLTFISDFGRILETTEDEITAADASWIDSLGPENNRWLFLVGVENLSIRTTFGRAAGAECLGVLFDRSAKKAVWRHEATFDFGVGGVVALAAYTQQTMAEYAMYGCIYNLFQHLPPR